MPQIETFTLTEGGQSAEDVAGSVVEFLRPAQRTLELALYDVRLPDPVGSAIADELRAAHDRGVEVRLVYNFESERPPAIHPPPRTRPEILDELPIATRAVPGIPDLMHHKYVVRDSSAVWTGSANWTVDSWTRQENAIAIVQNEALAQCYRSNFEELWGRQDVQRSGFVDPRLVDAGEVELRAWFTPGHGEELSQAIATAIGRARERVRIASPVITSGPILGTLAELADRDGADVAGVVDQPQTDTVFEQWAENGQSAWKIPLLAATLTKLAFSAKRSTPWSPTSVHDFMHAKVTVADDTTFLGSFNLSRSGERNAENVLEIRDPAIAERMAAYIEAVRGRYPAATIPDQSRSTISSAPSASSA
jgi:phosphatidylserine/phosphatidylglycerophosphate/cardiolipin synthase-like enzyme